LSPQLSVELRTKEGNLTQRANGVRTIYYHFIVYNKKKNNIARNAKVICEKLYVINSKGEIYKQPITTPLPLQWAFSEFYGYTRNIKDYDICDIGYLDENADKFKIDFLFHPNNMTPYIQAKESLCMTLKVGADNFLSREGYSLKISWDGVWDENMDEMKKHLIIDELYNCEGI
jgi:hypothetical protein